MIWTETEILRRLIAWRSNGGQYVVVGAVRTARGFNSSRTVDAIEVGLWPSRGHRFTGYEIKVSKSDFRRELKDAEKGQESAKFLSAYSLAVPKSLGIAAGDVPDDWGLVELYDDGGIRFEKHPPERKAEPPTAAFVASMFKAFSVGYVPRVDLELAERQSKELSESAGKWAYEMLCRASDEQAVRELSRRIVFNPIEFYSKDFRFDSGDYDKIAFLVKKILGARCIRADARNAIASARAAARSLSKSAREVEAAIKGLFPDSDMGEEPPA